ncbi:hypothetical protein CRYUN_Cryun38cG0019600 [Craigia yunnanensis]
MGFSLVDGSKISFWWDNWNEGGVLKLVFLRIFALSVNKDGKVKDFGYWINNTWSWKINHRRKLFEWELHHWHDLWSLLKRYVVSDNLKDSLI